MDDAPLDTKCLRCGLEKPMTIAEAMAHEEECRKAKNRG